MDRQFLCGAAKADITPNEALIHDLYGLMMIPYAGVIDHLHLRVLAFSDGLHRALVVAFDLDKAPNPAEWLPLLQERTGIPTENITYIGTHTHSAPLTTVRPREDRGRSPSKQQMKARLQYESFLQMTLLSTVDEALSGMVPARIGYGKGSSFINVNRNEEYCCATDSGETIKYVSQGLNFNREVDHTVHVVEMQTLEGQPIAFLVNYAMHCDVMFRNRYHEDGSMGISGDVAGTVSRCIETRIPGCVAVWSSGAAGDVNPIITNEMFYADPVHGRNTIELMKNYETLEQIMHSLAFRHLDDVMRVINSIREFSCSVMIQGAVEWSQTPGVEVIRTQDGQWKVGKENEDGYRIRLHLLRIGPIALFGIGGELYNSFGCQIQRQSPLTATLILNHDASLIEDAGYIMDDDTLDRIDSKRTVHGLVPGGRTPMVKGYVGNSLRQHTHSMFEKVM